MLGEHGIGADTALTASFLEPGITFRLIGQHYHDNANAYNPPAGKYPDLMLVGHLHSWAIEQTAPYYRLRSGPAHYFCEAGILEFRKVSGNWTCPSAAVHGSSNKIRPYEPWGTVKNVTAAFQLPNDGSPYTNRLTVGNAINESSDRIRLQRSDEYPGAPPRERRDGQECCWQGTILL